MCGCEAWTISKQLKKETRGKRNVFYKSQETAKKSIKTVLREADTTRSIINRIHKHQKTFFGHVMRRQKLEQLVTIGMIDTAGKDSLKR